MQYVLFCILVIYSISVFSQDVETGAIPASDFQSCHGALVEAKLDYYRRVYPDILFTIFKGGDESVENMVVLDTLLGPKPVNLDYEHPKELREDLMIVSAQRLWIMLKNRAPSATLFKADDPLGWQEHICVLTLDTCALATSNFDATANLLELPTAAMQKIPEKMQLDKKDYIEFTIDHEVYHCLKSMYIGPQTMSSHALWGEYNHYLEEKGADAYALAMHIRKHNRLTLFAENITRIRGISLFNADPNHFTCDALEQTLRIPIEEISRLSDAEVFYFASGIKEELSISYQEYLNYLAAAIVATKKLGTENMSLNSLEEKVKAVKIDQVLVEKLVESSRSCLSELRIERDLDKQNSNTDLD